MGTQMRDEFDLMTDLQKRGQDKELNDIKARINAMLRNIRFGDGRSIQDVRED